MTNIKARGFDRDSVDQLNDHLSDIAEPIGEDDGVTTTQEEQIAALRDEVYELRERVNSIRRRVDVAEGRTETKGELHPLVRIAAMSLATVVLGRIVKRLRLGAAGVAAVPMIAAQLDTRYL